VKVPVLTVESKSATYGLTLLAACCLVAAFLPETMLSNALLSLSYDREIEGLPLLIDLARCVLITMGAVTVILAVPVVRCALVNRFMPAPPAGLSAPYWPAENDVPAWFGFTAALFLMSTPVFAAFIVNPLWLHVLLKEDAVYEYSTAILYFASSILMAVTLSRAIRYQKPLGLVHAGWAALLLLLLWVGLEDMSYGQRVFHFSTPESCRAINQQEEFNLHNLATGATNRILAIAVAVMGIFLPMLSWVSGRFWHFLERIRIQLPQGGAVLAFAYATVYTVPSRFKFSAFDEQQLLHFAVLAAFLAFVVYSWARLPLRKTVPAQAVFVAFLIVAKSAYSLLADRSPVMSYPDEFKEWLIAFGFAVYACKLMRGSPRKSRIPCRASGLSPRSPWSPLSVVKTLSPRDSRTWIRITTEKLKS
jgi:hypothetical protein